MTLSITAVSVIVVRNDVLAQDFRIDDEAAQVALAVELRAMNRAIHGDGEALGEHDAGDDLLGRLATHAGNYSRKWRSIHGAANR